MTTLLLLVIGAAVVIGAVLVVAAVLDRRRGRQIDHDTSRLDVQPRRRVRR